MAKKSIDLILWEEGFYPFSMKFNIEKAIEKNKEELEPLEFDETTKSIYRYGGYFNSYFKEICKDLGEVLSKSLLDKSLFTELLIAALNRNELLISEDTKRAQLANDSLDRNSLSNTYIKKPEFQNNSEQSWGLIDAAIDTAILNLNYLNYVKFAENNLITNETEQVEVIRNMNITGSSFNAIKSAYDRIIWRGYTIEDEDSIIKLKSDSNHLMLDNVALTRLSRNIASTHDGLQYSPEDHKDIISHYHKTRKYQIIKSIEINDDKLVIKYQAKKKSPTFSYLSFAAPLLTYYPFYRSKEIAAFDNLTILDLVNLFSILYDFIDLLPLPDYDDTGIIDLKKFHLFNPKIKRDELHHHFVKTTKYTESQIGIFLNLLIQKGSKHNLYRYPIYESGEFLFFAHSTIKRANMLYLIDRWLDSGGCDLSDRGYEFEDYLVNFLKHEKLNEFAQFQIIEQSMFSFRDEENVRHEEEIDLVLKTDSTIILVEVKCITYPLEPNDFYSSFQTIKKAKGQIVRKAQFIEDNWGEFTDLLGEKGERKIEKIIVVNFPHYAGRNIDGIPITDFYLFLSYFKMGKLTNVKLEKGKAPVFSSIPYYNSKASFEKNFDSFFQNPIPIQDIMSRQEIEEYEVTLKGTEPKTMAQRVVYKSKTS